MWPGTSVITPNGISLWNLHVFTIAMQIQLGSIAIRYNLFQYNKIQNTTLIGTQGKGKANYCTQRDKKRTALIFMYYKIDEDVFFQNVRVATVALLSNLKQSPIKMILQDYTVGQKLLSYAKLLSFTQGLENVFICLFFDCNLCFPSYVAFRSRF